MTARANEAGAGKSGRTGGLAVIAAKWEKGSNVGYEVGEGFRSGFVSAVPSGSLRSYVASYGAFSDAGASSLRLLPLTGVTVVFTFDRWSITGTGQPLLTGNRSFAFGLSQSMSIAEQAGSARSIWLDLTPLGAVALFGVPGCGIRDRMVSLDSLLGAEADAITSRLYGLETVQQRFALLDGWLGLRIATIPELRSDVVRAWQILQLSGGEVGIHALTSQIGCSRRHLAQYFGEIVGLTPKAFGRNIRFSRAVASLLNRSDGLSGIALDYGYYDQAHFNRELRGYSGMSPTRILAEAALCKRNFGTA